MGGQRILMGVVGRPHGVRGLVHVHSYATVPADLAAYGTLHDDRGDAWTLRWQGRGIGELTGADGQVLRDRDAAQALVNRRLHVERDRLPAPAPDEFYLADLVGLAVFEPGGPAAIGTVRAVHDYGAGSSLEIGGGDQGFLLPFTRACVPAIDIAAGRLVIVRPDEIEIRPDGDEFGEAAE
ncbi:ribosome maturation factor RimM [Lichenicoccus sp.]|uniref:ribosome maturation factor RimM n=1 Tax=Lichenicoccus sp. TaxID=2781899 RepID=UPI003D129A0D